ncbi:MAG: VWA domain-containing protein, partial [Thermoanaerobaculia bacterium]|nr:VWA domain-containing protein [Thermoanaerobaculia bacterium]
MNVVEIDVVVTDADGSPVHGLTRDDFVLLEDGEAVQLTNFLAIQDALRVASAASAGEDAAIDPGTAEPGVTRIAVADPATVVLFFDNSQLVATHRGRVLEDLRGFVAGSDAPPGTRFMVVAYNPGLELVAPLTTHRQAVVEAIGRVEEMPALGFQAERERMGSREHVMAIWQNIEDSKGYGPSEGEPGPGNRRWKESASTAGYRGRFFDPCDEGWGPMLNIIDAAAERSRHHAESSRQALVELARSLAGIPGRKFVLHLSDGIPQVPGAIEYDILGQLCPDRAHELHSLSSRYDQSDALEELVALASLNRVTIYALDTAGLSAVARSSAEADDLRFTADFQTEASHRENLRASLHRMADGTGGRAFFDANRPGPELAGMGRDMGNFYSLGFSPANGWDGEVHKVKVRLAEDVDGSYLLRYRERYRALPREERYGDRTLSALLLGLEENPLGIEVRAGSAVGAADGAALVPIEIFLPVASLTTVADGERRTCDLRLVVAVQDAQGGLTPPRERIFPLELPSALGGGDRHSLVLRLPLGPGRNHVAFGIEDRLAGTASYLRKTIEVAP